MNKSNEYEIYLHIGINLFEISVFSNLDLKNLYNEISNYDEVIVSDISTILFYAMFLKKKVKIMLNDKKNYFFDKKIILDEDKKILTTFKPAFL